MSQKAPGGRRVDRPRPGNKMQKRAARRGGIFYFRHAYDPEKWAPVFGKIMRARKMDDG
jgi:hypothetical protein